MIFVNQFYKTHFEFPKVPKNMALAQAPILAYSVETSHSFLKAIGPYQCILRSTVCCALKSASM